MALLHYVNLGTQRTGENTANYTYDAIGQVIANQAYEVSGGAARVNEQLHYGFDPAGNLNYRTNNALIENFQVNALNDLTANTNGGKLTVMGTSTSPATSVAVNGTNALVYGDATFAATNMPLTTTYTATASDSLGRHATNTVTVSIGTSTTYQYDGNGNLTNDGLRNFAYDDENQLIQVWVANQWFSQFTYDGKMRRRIRQEYAWQGGAWVRTNQVYYVYDGNEVIQERDINNLPTTTYTRGKDLSGSLEGAGGIGGLLARTSQAYADGPLAGQCYYHADANGNVTMLINDAQAIVAKYLYDACGNIISKSGLLADGNLYRFSSKEAHANSGLVYYLYRYYDPNLQRWPNRDPIEEVGGVNLYGFVGNNPVSNFDMLGLLGLGGFSGPYNTFWGRWGGPLGGLFGTAATAVGSGIMGHCADDPCAKKGDCESCCKKGAAVAGIGIAAGGVAGCIGTGGIGCGISVVSGIINGISAYDSYKSCMSACASKKP